MLGSGISACLQNLGAIKFLRSAAGSANQMVMVVLFSTCQFKSAAALR
jgi:hypothetical protein